MGSDFQTVSKIFYDVLSDVKDLQGAEHLKTFRRTKMKTFSVTSNQSTLVAYKHQFSVIPRKDSLSMDACMYPSFTIDKLAPKFYQECSAPTHKCTVIRIPSTQMILSENIRRPKEQYKNSVLNHAPFSKFRVYSYMN